MKRIALILLSFTSVSWSIDTTSIENLLSRTRKDPENFIERHAPRDSPFAPFSPADSDLGEQMILVPSTGIAKVKLDLQSNIFWTNNILSAPNDKESSFFWHNGARLSWRPMLAPNLFFETSLGVDSFLFQHDDALNFENITFDLGLTKVLPQLGGLSLSARYQYQNLELDRTISPDPAEYHRIRLSAFKGLFSTRRHSAYLSLNTRFDLDSTPASVSRDEYALRLGYSYAITDSLQANAFYRIGQRHFQNIDRKDTFQMVGGDLTYRVSGACFIYASALWSENDSDPSPFAQDYHSVQLGLGISYQHQF